MLEGWPGEQLAIKILGTLETGVGALFRPWQIRRDHAAQIEMRRQERLALEQVEIDAAAIRSGQKIRAVDGTLLPGPAAESNTLPERPNTILPKHALDAREFQRSVNLRKIALYAEEEAEEVVADKDNVTSEEPVDPDWFARWRMFAEDVSNADMQRLWARVLAGEAYVPRSFTIHSMDFLARMSKTDAELLAKLAQFRINKVCIFADAGKLLEENGISMDDLIYLDDLNILNGVIRSRGGISRMFNVQNNQYGNYVTIDNNNLSLVLFRNNDVSINKLVIPVYSISKVGQEIMNLASFCSDERYLKCIADFADKNGFSTAKSGQIGPKEETIINLREL